MPTRHARWHSGHRQQHVQLAVGRAAAGSQRQRRQAAAAAAGNERKARRGSAACTHRNMCKRISRHAAGRGAPQGLRQAGAQRGGAVGGLPACHRRTCTVQMPPRRQEGPCSKAAPTCGPARGWRGCNVTERTPTCRAMLAVPLHSQFSRRRCMGPMLVEQGCSELRSQRSRTPAIIAKPSRRAEERAGPPQVNFRHQALPQAAAGPHWQPGNQICAPASRQPPETRAGRPPPTRRRHPPPGLGPGGNDHGRAAGRDGQRGQRQPGELHVCGRGGAAGWVGALASRATCCPGPWPCPLPSLWDMLSMEQPPSPLPPGFKIWVAELELLVGRRGGLLAAAGLWATIAGHGFRWRHPCCREVAPVFPHLSLAAGGQRAGAHQA